jgi:purine nucleosidase
MQRIIFDCDNTMGLRHKEIDDGLTLLYLLGRPDIEILGITTTFGNGTIDEVFLQTGSLLAELGRTDIPVYKGTGRRGQGFTPAANFLAETVAAHPGEIMLLATGPLGNLRAASEINPGLFSQAKQIICMGGYLGPLQIGWRSIAELNLSADPEASYVVLNAPCPVTLMNAQICLQVAFTWRDLSRIRFWSKRMQRIIRNWLLAFGLFCGVPRFYLWDLLPAVYLSYSDMFEINWAKITSSVGDLENGSLFVDKENRALPMVNMPAKIKDPGKFKDILFEGWSRVQA